MAMADVGAAKVGTRRKRHPREKRGTELRSSAGPADGIAAAAPAVATTAVVAAAVGLEANTHKKNNNKNKQSKKRKREKPPEEEKEGGDVHAKEGAQSRARTGSSTKGGNNSNNVDRCSVAIDGAKGPNKGKRRRSARPPLSPTATAVEATKTADDVGVACPPALACTSKVAEYTASSISGDVRGSGSADRDGGIANIPRRRDKRKNRTRPWSPCPENASNGRTSRHDKTKGTEAKDADDKAVPGESTNDSDNDGVAVEGVMHDGAMYLVDARRRVYSAERDNRGDLVQVGVFSDDRGEVVLEAPSSTKGNAERKEAKGVEALLRSATNDPPAAGRAMQALLDCSTAAGGAEVGGTETGAKHKSKKRKRKKKKRGKQEKNGEGRCGGEHDGGAGAVKDSAYLKNSAEDGGVSGRGAEDLVEYPFEVEVCCTVRQRRGTAWYGVVHCSRELITAQW